MSRLISLLPLLFVFCLADERLHDLPMDPCLNGGVLQNDGTCECTLRFEGARCEQERCLNGGRRHTVRGQVKCRCPFGLAGDRCEKVTRCEEGKGKLVNGKCECFEKNTGLFCQERLCYNGIPTGGKDGLCLCDIGFAGPFCDEQIICENSGFINNENECSCKPGYDGERCENCAVGFVKEGRFCIAEVSESSLLPHTGSLTEQPYAWPIIALGSAAAIIVVLAAVGVAHMLRKWNVKPSRVSSAQGSREGTDV